MLTKDANVVLIFRSLSSSLWGLIFLSAYPWALDGIHLGSIRVPYWNMDLYLGTLTGKNLRFYTGSVPWV